MVKQADITSQPENWLAAFKTARGENEALLVEKALHIYREPGNDALGIKGIAIADMLLQLDMDSDTIAAALLYPAVKHAKHHTPRGETAAAENDELSIRLLKSEEHITEHFGIAINKLLHDCMQMQSLGRLRDIAKYQTHQVENLRKMLLAMVTDIRAVLIILSERLSQLRDAKSLPLNEQQALARETLAVFAPLANRIGIWQLKWEIEDLCLRYLQPQAYSSIAKWLSDRRVERVKYVNDTIKEMTQLLQQAEVAQFEIDGRVKHIYSIYNKMQRKNLPIEEIYDISALRVLVPEISDCYAVLSTLQAQYKHIPQEFDDYIAQPKLNGYQSIHTVLYGPQNKIIEVQIRTQEMHHTSELGAASHWRYKEGVSQQAAYETKIALLRQIMGWQREVAGQTEDKPDHAVEDIFADRVYAFTPQGDIMDLPQAQHRLILLIRFTVKSVIAVAGRKWMARWCL